MPGHQMHSVEMEWRDIERHGGRVSTKQGAVNAGAQDDAYTDSDDGKGDLHMCGAPYVAPRLYGAPHIDAQTMPRAEKCWYSFLLSSLMHSGPL